MFDVDTYLAALGYSGPREATLDTLRDLHKRHLIAIPYDSVLNLGRGVDLWRDVDIDADATFDAIVVGGRGGVCFELNGLFRLLLTELGFDVGVFSAGVRQLDGTYGPDREHLFNHVRLDGELLMADVGFVGPSFLEPIRISDEAQHQYGNQFRVIQLDGYHLLQRRGQRGDWASTYRFRAQARSIAEWRAPTPDMTAFATRAAKASTVIRGRAFDNGQRIMIGKRYCTVDGGHDHIRGIADPAEHRRLLAEILRTEDTAVR
ncbi:arylamine N-acetyltransferase [Parafrankia sp. EUN1f]|uniref:arylamine N-acetyltransferase family protein n=1 Tax=Parafrankia sp. EUN1f TaxID=102897 RepID=UPI0001C45A68|nr:arylamine N-acetyltransferase [Parafrankia sp. EUN1f]EFC82754.1 N-acetyltransferase [Parafrankia sp. EUN1f]